MDVRQQSNLLKKIKVTLVFFSFVLLLNCTNERALNFEVIYNVDTAEAILFSAVEQPDNLSIYRKDASSPVLGDFSKNDKGLRFTPVLPFQSNTVYSIRYKGQVFEFKTESGAASAPEVLAVYPSADTVPENLLKFYVRFSQPMQRIGNITDYIKLKKQGTDAFLDVFLYLETELWNEDHTQITLWLDPGRVKKELIPNKERGNPLERGQHYELQIDPTFESAEGQSLKGAFVKDFYVTRRDTVKPRIEDWFLEVPVANSQDKLVINFNEALDAILLKETFELLESSGEPVAGFFQLGADEKSLLFTPLNNWKKDSYKLKIKALLEDLAANNLNRLFDEDLHKTKTNLNQAPHFFLDLKIE